jgi:hypothetical protein
MQRRTLLRIGLGATAALVVLGGGIALLQPGLQNGRLSAHARGVMGPVALAVLDGVLPADELERKRAIDAHLQRLDAAVAAFPVPTRSELSRLLALLSTAGGRLALAGLSAPWGEAHVEQIQQALQDMRTSRLVLRQQAYHALRDLTNAAYFSDTSAWAHLGYPGPLEI